jgi:VIT1/CCC1 family predicted Fe2+/Mn2+ transporter
LVSKKKYIRQGELHRGQKTGWLRAATLGANDGLISTSSLIVGVASASTSQAAIMLAAVAGLVAGALSMAAGEYVSVSSQADTEKADLSLEKSELKTKPEDEKKELAEIYMTRGLSKDLSIQVATQLMEHNALEAHARDELGINEITHPQPIQAAVTSAASFSLGAAPPTILAALLSSGSLTISVVIMTLGLLLFLGGLAAHLGGASLTRGALRVAFWGAVAMGCTFAIGRLFGSVA